MTMKKNNLFEKCASNVNSATRAEVERNMALSEEFWKEWSDAEIPEPIDAILWGMRKQEQIDFGKIDDDCEGCDLCRKVYQKKLIENAVKWLEKYMERLGYIDEWCRKGEDEFIKAMEKKKGSYEEE